MENYKKKPAEVSSSSTSLTPSMAKSNIRDDGTKIVSAGFLIKNSNYQSL